MLNYNTLLKNYKFYLCATPSALINQVLLIVFFFIIGNLYFYHIVL